MRRKILSKSKKILDSLSYEELIEIDNIKQCLGFSLDVGVVIPKGFRILEKNGLIEKEVGHLIKELKNLNNILDSHPEAIESIIGEKGKEISEKIRYLKNGLLKGNL